MFNKYYFLIFIIIILILVTFQSVFAEFGHLTILYLNDTHEHILPDTQDGEEIGGLARVATIVKQIEDEGGNILFLHAGDHITGSVFSNVYHGKIDMMCFDYMGLDATVVGNHEFDAGFDYLINELIPSVSYPVLSANIEYENTLSNESGPFMPYCITELGDFGMPIIIYGLTTPNTPVQTNPDNVEGLIFNDPVGVSTGLIEGWKDRYPVIIALTHLGLSGDKFLAKEVDGIDIIIGGHSHSFIYKPVKVGDTLICQAGQYGWYVGKIDLKFNEEGEVVDYKNTLIKVSDKYSDDEGLMETLAPYIEEVEGFSSQILCKLDFTLGEETDITRSRETNLGDLITDIMRAETGADVAITNSGGIRAVIYPPKVTVGDIMKAMPFNSGIVLCEMKGADLLNVFKHGYENQVNSGGYPQVSGARVFISEDGKVEDVLINNEKIDADKVYEVATVKFMVSGGDGYTMFENALSAVDTGLYQTDLMINFLSDRDTVPQPEMGRVVVE